MRRLKPLRIFMYMAIGVAVFGLIEMPRPRANVKQLLFGVCLAWGFSLEFPEISKCVTTVLMWGSNPLSWGKKTVFSSDTASNSRAMLAEPLEEILDTPPLIQQQDKVIFAIRRFAYFFWCMLLQRIGYTVPCCVRPMLKIEPGQSSELWMMEVEEVRSSSNCKAPSSSAIDMFFNLATTLQDSQDISKTIIYTARNVSLAFLLDGVL